MHFLHLVTQSQQYPSFVLASSSSTTDTHTHTHACMHAHVYTHTHTRMHTCTLSGKSVTDTVLVNSQNTWESHVSAFSSRADGPGTRRRFPPRSLRSSSERQSFCALAGLPLLPGCAARAPTPVWPTWYTFLKLLLASCSTDLRHRNNTLQHGNFIYTVTTMTM